MSSRSGRRLLASVAVATALVGGIGAGAGTAAAQTASESADAKPGWSSSDLGGIAIRAVFFPIYSLSVFSADGRSSADYPACGWFSPSCVMWPGQG